jgi:hypothetical protein
VGKSSIGSGYTEDAQLNMLLRPRKLKNQKSGCPPVSSDSSDVDEDKTFEATLPKSSHVSDVDPARESENDTI